MNAPRPVPLPRGAVGYALLVAVVTLALTTAWIHYSLGGWLFTLNAAGYVALAASVVAAAFIPLRIVQRLGWLPSVALIGYAAITIVAWAVMGPYFSLAYIAKGVEVALIAVLVADLFVTYAGPAGIADQLRAAGDDLRGGRRQLLARD